MLGHASIGSEHLLLGVMHSGDEVAVTALALEGIDLAAARQEV